MGYRLGPPTVPPRPRPLQFDPPEFDMVGKPARHAPLPDPIVRYSQRQLGRLGRLQCWTLHRTADLEVHLYGEVLSGSVADHIEGCLFIPIPYRRPPLPPKGPGGGSPRRPA